MLNLNQFIEFNRVKNLNAGLIFCEVLYFQFQIISL
jgi:hypothetical protein